MLKKPDWLENLLSSLVWHILSFTIDIGSPIESAIDWVLSPINAVLQWISELVAWASDIAQELLDFSLQVPLWINEVWEYILNLADTIGTAISDWWDGVKDTVTGWIDSAIVIVNEIIDNIGRELSELVVKVQEFFTVILPELATHFDVQEIIKTWFEPFAAILELMQVFQESIVDFFSDPIEFLWQRFTDWFLGRE